MLPHGHFLKAGLLSTSMLLLTDSSTPPAYSRLADDKTNPNICLWSIDDVWLLKSNAIPSLSLLIFLPKWLLDADAFDR